MTDYPALRVDLDGVAPATEHWRMIDELREKHRYLWNSYGDDGAGYWVLTRYDDILEAFQDPSTFGNQSIVPTDPDPAYRFLPSFIDPPQHVKYRKLLNRWFAPKAIAGFAPEITRVARELVAELAPQGAGRLPGRRSATSSPSAPSCTPSGCPTTTRTTSSSASA